MEVGRHRLALTFKNQRKKEPLFLTELQEQYVAEWYRDNEFLYNKAKKNYITADWG